MFNNGARNEALSLAFDSPSTRYALPLDSNCAFTPAGVAALLQTIVASEISASPKDYIVIPMSRLLDNDEFVVWNEPLDWSRLETDDEVAATLHRLRPAGPWLPSPRPPQNHLNLSALLAFLSSS